LNRQHSVNGGLGVEWPEARLKKGPSNDVVIRTCFLSLLRIFSWEYLI